MTSRALIVGILRDALHSARPGSPDLRKVRGNARIHRAIATRAGVAEGQTQRA